jgi:hypothetical protein
MFFIYRRGEVLVPSIASLNKICEDFQSKIHELTFKNSTSKAASG